MSAATLSRYGERSRQQRATSIALTVAAHLLLFWLLLHLGPSWVRQADKPPLTTFDVTPPPGQAAAPPAPRRSPKARAAAGGAPATAPAARSPLPAPVSAPVSPVSGQSIIASDFDLGTVPRRGSGEGSEDGAGKGDSVAAYGPGAGPGGERLYGADWAREPRPAELNGYLPNGVASGSWAMIACRTIPENQVENCRTLGEGPAGSGLARAMRQAAWQFRILPPRIGGKPIIGAWVRIRFDWTAGELRTR